MSKQVLVINGIDAVVFNEVLGVNVNLEDQEDFGPIQAYLVRTLISEMDYDGIDCDYHIETRDEVK